MKSTVRGMSCVMSIIVATVLCATASGGELETTALPGPVTAVPPISWGTALRQSAAQDLAQWTIQLPLTLALPPVLQQPMQHLQTGYDVVKGLVPGPAHTPVEALDKLGSLAVLGGPAGGGLAGGLLVPFLKGYYAKAFDALDAIDTRVGLRDPTPKGLDLQGIGRAVKGLDLHIYQVRPVVPPPVTLPPPPVAPTVVKPEFNNHLWRR